MLDNKTTYLGSNDQFGLNLNLTTRQFVYSYPRFLINQSVKYHLLIPLPPYNGVGVSFFYQ